MGERREQGSETWEKRVEGKLDLLTELLTGNGEPSKGLVVRVDRLEQSEERQRWWVGTAVGSAAAAVFAGAWSVLTGR